MTARTELGTVILDLQRIHGSLPPEAPAPKRAEVVLVIPCSWPDSDFPGGGTQYDNTLKGLLAVEGKGVISSAVVLTQNGGPELYDRLGRDLNGLKIIPGLISHSRMRLYFDDPHQWLRFIADVEAIVKSTGCDKVYLDFEASLKSYVYGKADLDVTIPDALIKLLPKNVTYIVYPAPYWFAEYPHGVRRLDTICRIIERQLSVRWLAQDFVRPDLVGIEPTRYARNTLLAFAKNTIDQLVWFYDKHDNWRTDQIVKVAEMAYAKDPGSVVYAYTGYEDWVKQAPRLVAALGG